MCKSARGQAGEPEGGRERRRKVRVREREREEFLFLFLSPINLLSSLLPSPGKPKGERILLIQNLPKSRGRERKERVRVREREREKLVYLLQHLLILFYM